MWCDINCQSRIVAGIVTIVHILVTLTVNSAFAYQPTF